MALKLRKLSLKSLEDLDPRLEKLFQKHLQQVAQDCIHRPNEKGKRKVLLEFEVWPDEIDPDTQECMNVRASVKAKAKVPTYQSKAYPFDVSAQGLAFNSEVPESLNQPGLGFEEGEGEAE